MIAWRYLRARRAEGGVSVMTWISLIGIALGVMALIVTLAVRAGFRTEFVDTILGSNAHVAVSRATWVDENGVSSRAIPEAGRLAETVRAIPGVTRAAPIIRGQAMATLNDRSNVAEVYGISLDDLKTIPRVAGSDEALGDIERFGEGMAIGVGIARDLGVGIGDRVKLIQPSGAKTAFGTSPRVNAYEVVYIFSAGRWDIDRTRIYLPYEEAQSFFNREAGADEIEVYVADPEAIDSYGPALYEAGGDGTILWTWRDSSGAFLNALDIEDDVMFLILALVVMIAALNITSGLVMLVKNKGRDIGILRTMGLTEGSVLRVFFLCGAFTGVIGTLAGVVLGCVIALNIDAIMSAINWMTGGGAWDPSIRGIYRLPAELRAWDLGRAVGLSLLLSFLVTIFPARRAARMNPVEALRYE
ncbi:lipoprotein-releasing ABC transporter permease subunit [Defluviimonas sp. WL0024]|uniref:Lipoprotein-releasing ABC transporter permease subunit n=2 Tax=Albidovulum TaxID=205889 RepID=A0ABT3J6E3_9RHOB|nr:MULTISPECIES: lipoprotein-releasing ABC transporter permease subunit [Defluviimonas]MCU9849641.1 lipoprotein-releasing ABC transporter permease subunit [Defluviimonas sp. WL0024]MCW3783237.1 lipoprotein-releasing ABC transporter permease subunit [Defluviimonas salinarum]